MSGDIFGKALGTPMRQRIRKAIAQVDRDIDELKATMADDETDNSDRLQKIKELEEKKQRLEDSL